MSGETRLEQFLLLAKKSKGLATAKAIQQATEEPGLFVFGELLDLPSVQELDGTDQASALALLRLFAYGTWPDYHSQRAQQQLPDLSSRQESKLRQLTVASLARTMKIVPYHALKDSTGLTDERQLEDFIITSCFYGGLVSGKLDPQRQCLRTHSAVARDIRREDLGPVLAGFQGWLKRAQDTAAMLDSQISHAKQTAAANAQQQAILDEKVAEAKKSIKTDVDPPGSSLPAGSEPEPMDCLDEERVPTMRQKRRR